MNEITAIQKRGPGRPKGSTDTKPRRQRGTVKQVTPAWVVIAPDRYRQCAAKGLNMADTAKEIGVTREAVRLAAIRLGLTFVRGRGQFDVQAIRDLLDQDQTAEQIASTTGVGVSTIRAIARSARPVFETQN